MSKKKSELASRRPISSTGELLVDAAKYNLTDDMFHRLVTEYAITEAEKRLEMTLECGHKRIIKKRSGRWWPDMVPGTWVCDVCRADAIFLMEDARRRRRQ